ncbi:phosphatidylglycerophosphate phosphatase PTPMT1 [Ricinus communis]|uniref:phosphatidylglycerophosphatase n=1 Tax=Ricinus communis TaxID=3988 RepID=B9SZP8_RICCO|nr:phosphatidylglycerophosphate phosphatase PTPMT1 [Ricinus communis]EEF30917.1 Protein-tyrosine phosphatase mitochondrial 1, mitochondrial precursor, putative [Ricinus communis]|eukprot:XP_002531467.1 putative dual specificity protein phosphatase DSP8 [Ricinus communis]
MIIEELKGGGEVERGEEEKACVPIVNESSSSDVVWDTKRVLIGAGARALFYPTLLYNVVRNKMQAEFRWWDRVDQFILLGAVPFPTDVPRLKELGVNGVITLNEPYETLVSTSLYQAHGIDHLVIPTRDYCFAPSLSDICLAVDFIHENVLQGWTTYVHCKAGRGRSTTIVICYLVQHRHMTPDAAYGYVRSIRPRVLLASAQWQAVQEYYNLMVKSCARINRSDLVLRTPKIEPSSDIVAFDDGSVVVVTEADLHGYDTSRGSDAVGREIWADLSVVYRVRVAGQAALARISCLWFRCQTNQKILGKQSSTEDSYSIRANHLGGISVDIHVY